jgi:hypothetical protein
VKLIFDPFQRRADVFNHKLDEEVFQELLPFIDSSKSQPFPNIGMAYSL